MNRSAEEISADLANVYRGLARLARLVGATIEGTERERFILACATELLGNAQFHPRTAAKAVLRWNVRHCRPPLTHSAALALFERAAAEVSP